MHSLRGYSVPCGKMYPAGMNFGNGFLEHLARSLPFAVILSRSLGAII